MNLSEPSAAVCPTLDGPVLVALASTTRPLAAREIARVVRRGSWSGVRQVLQRLAEHGIVSAQEAGNVTLYSLNRRHLAAPAVDLLTRLRDELIQRLSDTITSWAVPAAHASMFGSAARADGGVASDIDLFIVRLASVDEDEVTWRAQIDELAADVFAWTGNHAGVSEVGEQELASVRRTAAGRSIRSEGVKLAGEPIETILEG